MTEISSRTMINLIKYFGDLEFALTQTFLDKDGVQHYTIGYEMGEEDCRIVQLHEKYCGVNDVKLIVDYEIK